MTTLRPRQGHAPAGSPELSKRDRAVLESVAAHRFLTTQHIERLHFVDGLAPSAASRICRRVLKRMYEQRILHRLERRIGGVRAGSAGYVWSVGSRGDQYRSVERGEGIRRQLLEPSTTFLEHTLAVADAHLSLIEAARLGVFELVRVETEPDSWRSFMGRGAAETLRSDLFAITASGDYEDCWFIEVDRGTESLPTLVRKCQQYERYRGSGSEQADTGTFPLVLWVLPNQARIDKLTTALNRARAVDASLFRLTTPDGFVDVVRKGPG